MFGIFTSRAMRERGKYQIQCMKSRSSTGVGQKIDLDYNMETMRIIDSGAENSEYVRPQTEKIYDRIKPKSTLNDTADTETETAKVSVTSNSNKLKQMLAGLKSTNEV